MGWGANSWRMIRYVAAVLLATALLGIGFAAAQEVSVVRGETQVESEIAAIESAAASLLANDDPAPGDGDPPRRVVEVEFPADGVASASVDRLVFEPAADGNRTVARYRFEGRTEQTVHLDVPLTSAGPTDAIDLSASAGPRTVVLELVTDGGEPAIRMTVR